MDKFIISIVFGILLVFLFLVAAPLSALVVSDLPASRPSTTIIDMAEILSRSTYADINKHLLQLEDNRFDARLITIRGLEEDKTLNSFGTELVNRWSRDPEERLLKPLIIFLIDSKRNQAEVVSDSILKNQLPESLLLSTGRTTMSIPLKEGQRYRKASLDGIKRLNIVINGGDDPGPPINK